jgi:hypothetical protein
MHSVWKRRARYVITCHGRPIGLLLPLEAAGADAEAEAPPGAVWAELTRLGAEIGQGWKSPQSSTELLSAMRR